MDKIKEFYKDNLKFMAIMVVSVAFSYYICSFIKGSVLVMFCLRILVCGLISPIVITIMFLPDRNFRQMLQWIGQRMNFRIYLGK